MMLSEERRSAIAATTQAFLEVGRNQDMDPADFLLAVAHTFLAGASALAEMNGVEDRPIAAFLAACAVLTGPDPEPCED